MVDLCDTPDIALSFREEEHHIVHVVRPDPPMAHHRPLERPVGQQEFDTIPSSRYNLAV
jgi:hypothetical protein